MFFCNVPYFLFSEISYAQSNDKMVIGSKMALNNTKDLLVYHFAWIKKCFRQLFPPPNTIW